MITLAVLFSCLLLIAAVLYAWLSVPSWRRWGSSDEEFAKHYPHDGLVPGANMKSVRAITINAPVRAVWPWIAQIGRGAGWYSIDFLDNRGKRSADYIMDIPEPALGDETLVGILIDYRKEGHTVYFIEDTPFLGTRSKFAIGHVVDALDENHTRLCLVARVALTQGSPLIASLALFVNDVMETIMGKAQLKNLKRVIETWPDRLKNGDVHRVPGEHGHQKAAYSYAGNTRNP